jgi:hypothetical protein
MEQELLERITVEIIKDFILANEELEKVGDVEF